MVLEVVVLCQQGMAHGKQVGSQQGVVVLIKLRLKTSQWEENTYTESNTTNNPCPNKVINQLKHKPIKVISLHFGIDVQFDYTLQTVVFEPQNSFLGNIYKTHLALHKPSGKYRLGLLRCVMFDMELVVVVVVVTSRRLNSL